MQGLTDRDIAYDILFATKQTSSDYCTGALEAASPTAFRMFMQLHDRTQDTHRRVWEFLHQRQEYRVSEAHPEEVRSAQQRMERLRENQMHGATERWEDRGRFAQPTPWGPGGPVGPGVGPGVSSSWDRPLTEHRATETTPRY